MVYVLVPFFQQLAQNHTLKVQVFYDKTSIQTERDTCYSSTSATTRYYIANSQLLLCILLAGQVGSQLIWPISILAHY